MHVVNGLHHYLSDDPELVQSAEKIRPNCLIFENPKVQRITILDRKIPNVRAPKIAMFGMDCALGNDFQSLAQRSCRKRAFAPK
ncbi:MAG: hypothetical protein Ct9H300mP21_01460 [Pseudomonadota bacterium]|nr:MAG: hypothetical protein Ct9H300mP21_01460 [Pseudomonadota bacterium]